MAGFRFLGHFPEVGYVFGLNAFGLSKTEVHRLENEAAVWCIEEAAGSPKLPGNDGTLVPNGVVDGSVYYIVLDRLRDAITFEQKFDAPMTQDALSSASFMSARRAVAA